MSILSQFTGGELPPRAIINYSNSGGVNANVPAASNQTNLKFTNSGAVTANTLKTVLSITGSGSIQFLAVGATNTTSKTQRIRVTIDGVVAYDATSSSSTSTDVGLIAIGSTVNSTTRAPVLDNVLFASSLLVEVTTSVSETDGISIRYQYRTN